MLRNKIHFSSRFGTGNLTFRVVHVLNPAATEICNRQKAAKLQGDQKVSVHLTNNPHTIDELKMAITQCIQNVDRAILSMVFFQV